MDTKILICYVIGFTKVQLITQNNYILSDKDYSTFNNLVKQRQNGVPLNYIIGYKEFYSRNFKVNSATLIPRPETEQLVEQVLALIKSKKSTFTKSISPKIRLLDLGTGSGCIAITCKLEQTDLEVFAVDDSINALTIAIENAIQLKAKVEFIQSNWYDKVIGKFTVIVSNPPYIAKDDEHLASLMFEPQQALTDDGDGLSCLTKIIKGSLEHLEAGGYLVLEHGYKQSRAVQEILQQYDFTEITTLKDYANLDRITFGLYS